jgi:hypothetical protein
MTATPLTTTDSAHDSRRSVAAMQPEAKPGCIYVVLEKPLPRLEHHFLDLLHGAQKLVKSNITAAAAVMIQRARRLLPHATTMGVMTAVDWRRGPETSIGTHF